MPTLQTWHKLDEGPPPAPLSPRQGTAPEPLTVDQVVDTHATPATFPTFTTFFTFPSERPEYDTPEKQDVAA